MQSVSTPASAALRVGGFVPLSMTDFPGHLAAVIFCQGCPWRCGYCHNPHLLPRKGEREIAWLRIARFLERRRGLLDAVVFSGGEPTLQAALPHAMQAVKSMGFKVGLHTAGIYPRRLATVLPLVDWVGMDVKTRLADYADVTGVNGSGERARKSMELILSHGVAHEFRTTAHPAWLLPQKLAALAAGLAQRGVRHYAVQAFRNRGCTGAISPAAEPPLDEETSREIAAHFSSFTVRTN